MTDQQLFLVIGVQSLAILLGAVCQALLVVWHTRRLMRKFKEQQ